jgi:guanylate cyclase
VYLDGLQLPNSPFLIQCDRVPCEDATHIANATGYCHCDTNSGAYVQTSTGCIPSTTLAVVIVVPSVVLVLGAVLLYSSYKLQKADSVWKIQFENLHFADPPEILGRGTFGLVVAAEYRNTSVAVKRVAQPLHAMHGIFVLRL